MADVYSRLAAPKAAPSLAPDAGNRAAETGPSPRVKGARFPRGHKLTSADDFKAVFDQACKSISPELAVLSRPNALPYARLGLAISRKCSPRAVERNRVKRIIRESFRAHGELLAGLDIVVVGRPGVAARTNPDLFADLDRHWQKLARKCKKSSSP